MKNEQGKFKRSKENQENAPSDLALDFVYDFFISETDSSEQERTEGIEKTHKKRKSKGTGNH